METAIFISCISDNVPGNQSVRAIKTLMGDLFEQVVMRYFVQRNILSSVSPASSVF